MDSKFHLAFNVKDIKNTIKFYHTILGCELGRPTEHWVDFNFFGHQLSTHVSDKIPELDYCEKVEGLKVPIPHFGCIIDSTIFNGIKENLEKYKIDFVFKPQKRYKDKIGNNRQCLFLTLVIILWNLKVMRILKISLNNNCQQRTELKTKSSYHCRSNFNTRNHLSFVIFFSGSKNFRFRPQFFQKINRYEYRYDSKFFFHIKIV